jgi:hypothetical protein
MPFDQGEVAVVSLSASLIAGLSLFCLPQFVRRVSPAGKRPHDDIADRLYEDEDGVATPESMARYTVRPQKIVLLLAACCGFGFSMASSINATVNAVSKSTQTDLGELVIAWIFTADWVCFRAFRHR